MPFFFTWCCYNVELQPPFLFLRLINYDISKRQQKWPAAVVCYWILFRFLFLLLWCVCYKETPPPPPFSVVDFCLCVLTLLLFSLRFVHALQDPLNRPVIW